MIERPLSERPPACTGRGSVSGRARPVAVREPGLALGAAPIVARRLPPPAQSHERTDHADTVSPATYKVRCFSGTCHSGLVRTGSVF